MLIEGTRFGRIEVEDDKLITLKGGLVGFGDETLFVLHESANSPRIAWLQSAKNPNLAFPVIDGAEFGEDYPSPSAATLAEGAGLQSKDLAVLVVVAARPQRALVANLLAPIVIDVANRQGAQCVLDPRVYSAQHTVDPISLANALGRSGALRQQVEPRAAAAAR
jgi:flagellar assembly factor FliW